MMIMMNFHVSYPCYHTGHTQRSFEQLTGKRDWLHDGHALK